MTRIFLYKSYNKYKLEFHNNIDTVWFKPLYLNLKRLKLAESLVELAHNHLAWTKRLKSFNRSYPDHLLGTTRQKPLSIDKKTEIIKKK